MKQITLPMSKEVKESLAVGDLLYLSGTIYTARDAAHKRLNEMLDNKEALPIELEGATIYYVGPTPTPPNKKFGSAGPTTSMRMDVYASRLYDLGVCATIGKGYRSQPVVDAIARNEALYLVAIGGAGALLSKCVVDAQPVAFADLGAEAIVKLEVKDFPVTVAIDTKGRNIYE